METFKVIIEISQGTENNKYEYDEKSGEFKLDFVFKNLVWPFNYGFLPKTLGGDGDALDAIVLSSKPLSQAQEVECYPIGALAMLDRGEEDDKLIFVPAQDLLSQSLRDISDVSLEQKKAWEELYAEIARQKKKVIEIKSFLNKEQTINLINKSLI